MKDKKETGRRCVTYFHSERHLLFAVAKQSEKAVVCVKNYFLRLQNGQHSDIFLANCSEIDKKFPLNSQIA